jgi:hypothetical protein
MLFRPDETETREPENQTSEKSDIVCNVCMLVYIRNRIRETARGSESLQGILFWTRGIYMEEWNF